MTPATNDAAPVAPAAALHIAGDLALPFGAVTETFAILGRRGSGKTTTAAVVVEEMLTAGAQVAVIDPLDAWWGLRSAADGERPGLPIVVLGGAHGDLPLNAGDGDAVADVVVAHGVSVVLSLRHLSKTQQRAFVAAFAERLYERKGEPGQRSPLFLVIDEASLYAPQRTQAGQERLLGAISDIGRRGRTSGLGLALIDQRAASVNKDVLSQTEVLLVGQTTSSHDRNAIRDWIAEHADPEQQKALLASLPALTVGEFWVCSPSWLHLFARVRIRPRTTFDSSATPRFGDLHVEPRRLAPVDLDALRAHLGRPAETTHAGALDGDETTLLRRRIAVLEKEVQEAQATTRTVVEQVEVPMIAPDDLAALVRAAAEIAQVANRLHKTLMQVAAATVGTPTTVSAPVARSSPPAERQRVREVELARPEGSPADRAVTSSLSAPQKRILDALAWFEALGVAHPARANVAVFSNAAPSSGAFNNNLGRLRTQGLLDYPTQGHVALTSAGRAVAAPPAIATTRAALHDAWYGKLPPRQRALLRLTIAAYPHALSRDELAAQSGASAGSGAYNNNLGALRSLGVIDYPRPGHVVATPLLFPQTAPGARS